jgi:hypothetical protein
MPGLAQLWDPTTPLNNATADAAINWREGQAPSTVNNSARQMMATIKRTVLDQSGKLLSAGTGTAFTLTSNEVFTSLIDGLTVAFRAHADCGFSPTLNVDGLGAVALHSVLGTPITKGFLRTGRVYHATYVASSPAWVVQGMVGASNLLQPADLTITVGSGGDFANLNAALAYASTLYPLYVAGATPNITVNLLTGYTETSGVNIAGIDLSYITIASVDATVTANVAGDLFHAENARLPKIAARFDMGGNGGHGIWLAQASVIVASPNAPTKLAGIINAGKSGLYPIAMGEFATLDADFQGAQEFGAYINHASWGELGGSDFSGAGLRGGVSDELGAPFDGIHVAHSSRVNISDCNGELSGGAGFDLRVRNGGIVDIVNFTGGLSQSPNVLTAAGIIFAP